MLEAGIRRELLANETNYFLAQIVARTRPHFRTLQMFYTCMQAAQLKRVSPGIDESPDAFLQSVEERQLVSGTRCFCDIQQRERDRRRGR